MAQVRRASLHHRTQLLCCVLRRDCAVGVASEDSLHAQEQEAQGAG